MSVTLTRRRSTKGAMPVLSNFERYPLTFGPTPIERLARLTEHLAARRREWPLRLTVVSRAGTLAPCDDGAVMVETLLIGLGGALGTVGRYWIGLWMLPLSRELPWGTILINVAGSFAISFFGTLTLSNGRYPVPEAGRLFFMVGVCGGFTTFSSFSLQTLDLLRGGAAGRALVNIAASVLLCLGSVTLGYLVASQLNGHATRITQTAAEEETG